jgi:excisionase family DNA binding protein
MTAPEGNQPEQSAGRLLSIEGAATYLSVSTKTIRRRIASGDLPAYRVGRNGPVRLRVTDLEAYLEPVTALTRPPGLSRQEKEAERAISHAGRLS